jgi:hypothetical protein
MTTITFPVNAILFRGQDIKLPILTKRPAYYTYDQDVAGAYGPSKGYVTTRPLRLLDIRFIRSLLQTFMLSSDGFNAERLTLALAYGTCTLESQIKLVQQRYRDNIQKIEPRIASMQTFLAARARSITPLDVPGIRLADTTNDMEAVMLLKSIFKSSSIDGYIAPRLHSPYHVEKENCIHPPELVLFDPASSGLRRLVQHEKGKSYNAVKLDTLLASDGSALHEPLFWEKHKVLISASTHRGGGRKSKISTFDPNALDKLSEKDYNTLERRTNIIGPQLLGARIYLPTGPVGKRIDGSVSTPTSHWIPFQHTP